MRTARYSGALTCNSNKRVLILRHASPLATPVVAAASAAMAQRPILTDGIRPRPGREQQVSIAQEQLNEYLQRYMAEQGLALPALQAPGFADFGTNRRPGPPRAAGYVTCYKYGQGGRYSDSCMNRPLSAEYRVRAREEAERRDWNRRRSGSLPASPFSPAGSFPSTDHPRGWTIGPSETQNRSMDTGTGTECTPTGTTPRHTTLGLGVEHRPTLPRPYCSRGESQSPGDRKRVEAPGHHLD